MDIPQHGLKFENERFQENLPNTLITRFALLTAKPALEGLRFWGEKAGEQGGGGGGEAPSQFLETRSF